MARFYHGGQPSPKGIPLWFAPTLEYAEGYARKSNGQVWYIDLSDSEAKQYALTYDNSGTGMAPSYSTFEAPAHIADRRQLMPGQSTNTLAAAVGSLGSATPGAAPTPDATAPAGQAATGTPDAAMPPPLPDLGPRSWGEAFDKWDKQWEMPGEASADAPILAEEDLHAEYLKKILAKVDELLNNVGILLEDDDKAEATTTGGEVRPADARTGRGHEQPKKSRVKQAARNIGVDIIRAAASFGF